MAGVFGEEHVALGDDYLARLLSDDGFWVVAAWSDGNLVGGITAHALPMTRSESYELFVYDIAVLPKHQRQGFGQELMRSLRTEAGLTGITTVFVAADDEDVHALDFYRTLGGTASSVTMFSFGFMDASS